MNERQKCYAMIDITWQPVLEFGYESSRYIGKNIWQNKIININETQNNNIYG